MSAKWYIAWKHIYSWFAFAAFIAICLRVPRTLNNEFFSSLLQGGSNFYEDSCHLLRIDWLCKNNAYLAFSIPAFWGLSALVLSKTNKQLFLALLSFTAFALMQLYMSSGDGESGYIVQLVQSMVRMVRDGVKLLFVGIITFDTQYMGAVMHYIEPLFNSLSVAFGRIIVNDLLLVTYGFLGILLAGWRVKSYVDSTLTNGLLYTITCTLFSNAIIGLVGYLFDTAYYRFIHLLCFWICDSLRQYPSIRTALSSRIRHLHRIVFSFIALTLSAAVVYFILAYFGVRVDSENHDGTMPLCFQTATLENTLSNKLELANYGSYILKSLRLLIHSITQAHAPYSYEVLVLVFSVLILQYIPLSAGVVTIFVILSSSKYTKIVQKVLQSPLAHDLARSTLTMYPDIVPVTHQTDLPVYASEYAEYILDIPWGDDPYEDEMEMERTVLHTPPLDIFDATYLPPFTAYSFIRALLGFLLCWIGPFHSVTTKNKNKTTSNKTSKSRWRTLLNFTKNSALFLSCCGYILAVIPSLAHDIHSLLLGFFSKLPSSLQYLVGLLAETRLFAFLHRLLLFSLEVGSDDYYGDTDMHPLAPLLVIVSLFCMLYIRPPPNRFFRLLLRVTYLLLGIPLLIAWILEVRYDHVEVWGVDVYPHKGEVKACIGFAPRPSPQPPLLTSLANADEHSIVANIVLVGVMGYFIRKCISYFFSSSSSSTTMDADLTDASGSPHPSFSSRPSISQRVYQQDASSTDDDEYEEEQEEQEEEEEGEEEYAHALVQAPSRPQRTNMDSRPFGRFRLNLNVSAAHKQQEEGNDDNDDNDSDNGDDDNNTVHMSPTAASNTTGWLNRLTSYLFRGRVAEDQTSTHDDNTSSELPHALDTDEYTQTSVSRVDESDAADVHETMLQGGKQHRVGLWPYRHQEHNEQYPLSSESLASNGSVAPPHATSSASSGLRRRGRRGSQTHVEGAEYNGDPNTGETRDTRDDNIRRRPVFFSKLYSHTPLDLSTSATSASASAVIGSSPTHMEQNSTASTVANTALSGPRGRNRRGSILSPSPSDHDHIHHPANRDTNTPSWSSTPDPEERPRYNLSSLINRVLPPTTADSSPLSAPSVSDQERLRATPSPSPGSITHDAHGSAHGSAHGTLSFAFGHGRDTHSNVHTYNTVNQDTHIRPWEAPQPSPTSSSSSQLSRFQQFLLSAKSIDAHEQPDVRKNSQERPLGMNQQQRQAPSSDYRSMTNGSYLNASSPHAENYMTPSAAASMWQHQAGSPPGPQSYMTNTQTQHQSLQLSSPLTRESNLRPAGGSFNSLYSHSHVSPRVDTFLPGEIPHSARSDRSSFSPGDMRPNFPQYPQGNILTESPGADRMQEDDEVMSTVSYQQSVTHDHGSVRPRLTLPGLGQSQFSTALRR